MTNERSTSPGTRDLRELLDALAIVEAECRFQSARLSENNDEFLSRMSKRYDEATGTLVTLRRYQEGRLAAQTAPRGEYDNAVQADGVATAHTGEEE